MEKHLHKNFRSYIKRKVKCSLKESKIDTGLKLLLVFFFLLIIFLPFLQMKLHILPEGELKENRKLAKNPVFNFSMLDKFPEEYENYFNDNFGFRNKLIQWGNKFHFKFFGNSSILGAVIGKDGWLFLREGINYYFGSSLFSSKELTLFSTHLKNVQSMYEKRGIYFLVVVIPNKDTCYPEYLPDDVKLLNRETSLDQKLDYLHKYNSNVDVLDLRPSLINAKKRFPVYYKTDSHWNRFGGYIGYQEIMKKIHEKFPDVSLLSDSDFTFKEFPTKGEADLAKMFAMEDSFSDLDVSVELKDSSLGNITNKLPKLLIINDSFMNPDFSWSSVHFLSLHFEKTVIGTVVKDFKEKTLDQEEEKPTVVILEKVERNFNL